MLKPIYKSGNIILDTKKAANTISLHIKELLLNIFKYDIPVLTLSQEELKICFLENPFLELTSDIKTLHVTFLNKIPDKALIEQLETPVYKNDQYTIIKKNIYLYTPDGYAKTKFSNAIFEKKLNIQATTRNWKTVTKLYEMILTN